MRKWFCIAFVFLGLAACDPNKHPTVLAYQTIGSACIAATGALEVLAPMRDRGMLNNTQIANVDDAVLLIDPICGAGDIPSYRDALQLLNTQILVLEGIIQQTSGV